MSLNEKSTREIVVEAADKLFYEKGFENTTFAHIAKEVGISRGNFYYHFKTKDDILNAVVELRYENTKKMLNSWNMEGDDPLARIKCFIHILVTNRSEIKSYGCPVGTLSSELAKLKHSSFEEHKAIFTLFRDWLKKQFILLGKKSNADNLSMHLLALSQGVATLGNAYGDNKFINREVKTMCDWVTDVVNS